MLKNLQPIEITHVHVCVRVCVRTCVITSVVRRPVCLEGRRERRTTNVESGVGHPGRSAHSSRTGLVSVRTLLLSGASDEDQCDTSLPTSCVAYTKCTEVETHTTSLLPNLVPQLWPAPLPPTYFKIMFPRRPIDPCLINNPYSHPVSFGEGWERSESEGNTTADLLIYDEG